MRERGFTLIEVVVVMAIAGILLTIGTLYFNSMQKKTAIEQEVTTIYSTLMSVRLEALYTKTPRIITFSGKQMNVFSSYTALPPVQVTTLPYPVKVSNNNYRVQFDASGLMMKAERSICVDPTGTLADNPGFTDSVDVDMAKIYVGKRRSGETCVPASIDQK